MMVPAQLSCEVGAVTVTEHSPVALVNVGATGGVTSSTITVCCAVLLLPLPSLKVQVMLYDPCVV